MNKVLLIVFATLLPTAASISAEPRPVTTNDETNNLQQTTLDNIRVAMAKRDLEHAKRLLENAEKSGSPAYVAQLDRLELILGYLERLWKAVADGAQTLRALDEMVVGTTRVAVVEVTNERIVLRVLGKNKRYGIHNMPPKLVVTLAKRALSDDKQNQVFLAMFHLVDKSGDRAEAQRLLNEAKRAGVSIGTLLEELSVDRPGVVDIDIPTMTPAMRSLLSPRRWIVLKTDGSRVPRASLIGAEQNTEGRLVIAATDQSRIIVFQTRLAANFGCRMILQSKTKGIKFGLHSNAAPEQAILYSILLPARTSLRLLANVVSGNAA